MAAIPSPSPSELVLLKQLWKAAPLSAREVHNAVEPQLAWSFSSTRKTLERMGEKGLLDVSIAHGVTVYRPLAGKVATLAAMLRTFAQQVLELEGPLPVASFVESRLLDEDELAELEALLEQPPRKRRRKGDPKGSR